MGDNDNTNINKVSRSTTRSSWIIILLTNFVKARYLFKRCSIEWQPPLNHHPNIVETNATLHRRHPYWNHKNERCKKNSKNQNYTKRKHRKRKRKRKRNLKRVNQQR